MRDPSDRRKDDAFCSTDRAVAAACSFATDAQRWALEVTLHSAKQHLGYEDPQNQTPRAVLQTAPLAGIGYALALLWDAGRIKAYVALPAVTAGTPVL